MLINSLLTNSLRVGALCVVIASVVATGADAQHRGGHGGGGGGGGGGGHGFSISRGGGGGGFSIGRSIGHAAPSFRSAPRFSAPAIRHSVTPRNLQLGSSRRSITTRNVT